MRFETIRRLWSLFDGRERRQVMLLGLLMVGSGMLEFVSVSAVPGFIVVMSRAETILQHSRVQPVLDWLGIETETQLALAATAGLIGVFAVRGAFFTTMSWYQAFVVSRIARNLTIRLFALYLDAPYTLHLTRNTAQYTHVLSGQIPRVISQFLTPLLQLTLNAIVISALIVLLLVADPVASVFVGALAGGGCYLFVRLTQKKMTMYGLELSRRGREMLQSLNEALGSVKHVTLRGLGASLKAAFAGQSDAREIAMRGQIFNATLPKPIFETVGIVALSGLAAGLLLLGRTPESIVPTLALLGAVAVRLLPTLNQMTANLARLPANAIAVTNVANDFDLMQRSVSGRPKPSDSKKPVSGDIVFRDVTFRYEGQARDALAGISLDIPKGSSAGFVGPTGSGKTTAIDALLGFLPLVSGSISVGGLNIAENLSGWQRTVGYIPQTIFLIDASIRRNVALGVPSAEIDEAAVWRALEDAQLADFVRDLPDGLETRVGERGVRLSGGQRQRIGIARALYHEPEVLVLDEATAALDNATEAKLMAAIEQAKHGRTLIMIAHRLSTVRNCDRIFFLKEGKIVGRGTYDYLIEQSEDFRQLANLAA